MGRGTYCGGPTTGGTACYYCYYVWQQKADIRRSSTLDIDRSKQAAAAAPLTSACSSNNLSALRSKINIPLSSGTSLTNVTPLSGVESLSAVQSVTNVDSLIASGHSSTATAARNLTFNFRRRGRHLDSIRRDGAPPSRCRSSNVRTSQKKIRHGRRRRNAVVPRCRSDPRAMAWLVSCTTRCCCQC